MGSGSVRAPMALGSAQGQRIGWLDVGRGLLVISVVVLHTAGMFAEQGAQNAVLLEPMRAMTYFRIPTLFVLSGVLFSVYAARPWRLVIRNRLLVFVWVLVVWLAVRRLVNAWIVGEPVFGPVQLVRDVVPQVLEPASHLWFIWCLAVVTMVSRIFVRRPWVLLLLFAVAIAGVLPGADRGLPVGTLYSAASFFLLGLAGAPLVLRYGSRVGPVTTAVSTAALIGLVMFLQRPGILDQHLPTGIAVLVIVVPAVPAVIGLSRGIATIPGSGALKYVGQRTLHVYAMHFTLSMVVVETLADRWPDVFSELPHVGTLALAAFCVGLPLLVGAVLRKLDIHGVFDVPLWVLRCVDAVWPGSSAARARVASPGAGAGDADPVTDPAENAQELAASRPGGV